MMRPRLAVICFTFLAACGGNNSTDGGATSDLSMNGDSDGGGSMNDLAGADLGMSASFIDALLAAHNAVRAAAMPAPTPALNNLTWSASAAQVAADWAAECNYAHNSKRGNLGENIFAGSAQYTPQQVVDAWASETANYNYAANTCAQGQICGHYTQIVWKTTTQIGCAKQRCNTPSPLGNNWEFWVCDYAPPGNVNNARPY